MFGDDAQRFYATSNETMCTLITNCITFVPKIDVIWILGISFQFWQRRKYMHSFGGKFRARFLGHRDIGTRIMKT